MKLRTGLQISAILPIALAILVSLGLLIRSNLIRTARSRRGIAEEVITYATDLQTAAYASLLRADAHSESNWKKQADRFKKFLGTQKPRDVVEEIALDNIAENRDALAESFGELMVLRRRHGLTIEISGPDSRKYAQLKQDLEVRSMAILEEAFKLARTHDRNAAAFEDMTDKLVLVFIGVTAMLMAAGILSASRSTIKRLGKLKTVADQVSQGDLQHRLDTSGNDELSESFRAFNKMLARLDLGVSSHGPSASSVKEVEESKRAADAARQSNMHLADALTKLKRAQDQIVLRERLHALEQVGAGVTKAFADSLTPIMGTSDFLLDDPAHLEDREDLVRQLKLIRAGADEAMKKVRDLADVFRPAGQAQSECVDLNLAAQKAMALTEPKWKPVAHPDQHITCGLTVGQVPMVEGTEIDLTEAIVHLIANAVDATEPGGSITLATAQDGNEVVLTVADTGEGMTEEVKARCLEPFFSTRGGDHSGMGLSTSLAIAGRYGGSLTVQSEKGAGTTITMRLPVCNGSGSPAPTESAPALDRKLNILVVEDEEWVRTLLYRALTRGGHKVVLAENGNDGIGKCQAGEFDLMILDRAMPDMTGDDVAAIVSHNHPELPVMMLTGFGDTMIKDHVTPKGVDLVVSKPVTMQTLRDAIARTLAAAHGRKGSA